MPPLPRDLLQMEQHLHEPRFDHLAMTGDTEDWLYRGVVGAEGERSALFASNRVLRWLLPDSPIFADGTFRVQPTSPKCSQLFTVVAMHEHKVSVFCIVAHVHYLRGQLPVSNLLAGTDDISRRDRGARCCRYLARWSEDIHCSVLVVDASRVAVSALTWVVFGVDLPVVQYCNSNDPRQVTNHCTGIHCFIARHGC